MCISDTHSQVEHAGDTAFSVPGGDILIHAGDMTQWGEVPKVKEFNDWMGTLPHKHKVRIVNDQACKLVGPLRVFRSAAWPAKQTAGSAEE